VFAFLFFYLLSYIKYWPLSRKLEYEMFLVFFKGLSVPAVPGALGPLTLTSSAVAGRMAIPGASGIPGNSVLLVTNLNPDVS
jgi:hypothetical protein